MAMLETLRESIMEGDEPKVRKIVEEAVKNKVPVKEILNDGLIGAMNVVGVKFRNGELFVPEVLMAAKAMKAGMEVLKPLFDKSGVQPIGRIVIGTVKGDLHDNGKNLVAMMVEGSGFEIIDLGVDVPPDRFVDAVKTNKADLCMMSALTVDRRLENDANAASWNPFDTPCRNSFKTFAIPYRVKRLRFTLTMSTSMIKPGCMW
jgi:5-methyltetrahydrofolate--homocysteine methyltransferase